MTREEAIRQLDGADIAVLNRDFFKFNQAIIMAISAIRQQDQSPDSEKMMQREPITNADRLNAMTIEGKAEFISSIAYVRETPWSEPFSRRMCDSCPTVHGTYESGIEDDFHECDFVDGKCPHGSAIVWWLKQPAEEDDHGHES